MIKFDTGHRPSLTRETRGDLTGILGEGTQRRQGGQVVTLETKRNMGDMGDKGIQRRQVETRGDQGDKGRPRKLGETRADNGRQGRPCETHGDQEKRRDQGEKKSSGQQGETKEIR